MKNRLKKIDKQDFSSKNVFMLNVSVSIEHTIKLVPILQSPKTKKLIKRIQN